MNPVHIVFFSGTGGTALAAETLAGEFESRGVPVKRSEIFRENIPLINQEEVLIVMYPVYAGMAPGPVIRYLKRIPAVLFWKSLSKKKIKESRAVVISVSGGGDVSPNTASRAKVVRKLKKKGFDVTHQYMFCMPSNFFVRTDREISEKLIQILPEKCKAVSEEICRYYDSPETSFRRTAHPPLLLDRFLGLFFRLEHIGSKVFGRTLKSTRKCTGCGLCATNCPIGNIRMSNGKPQKPLYGWKCVLCMRCIYLCPQKSIYHPFLNFLILKEGFNISRLRKEAEASLESDGEGSSALVSSGQVKKRNSKNGTMPKRAGLLWRGVYYYLTD